jgi:hypothetical protein
MEKKEKRHMKKQTGIWIDGSKAIIISLDSGKETVREIPSNIESRSHHVHQGDKGTFMGTHHLNHEERFNERKKHQTDAFLKNVLDEVKHSDELFVMGPSLTKKHLMNRLEESGPQMPVLRGLETCDHLTVNQCVARVKEFFNTTEKQ